MKKEMLCTAVGVVGSTAAKLFGAWSPSLTALLWCMCIDLITGLIVALAFHKSSKSETGAGSSTAMFRGLCKKFVMLLLVVLAHQMDIVMGKDVIMTAVVYGFIANEAFSVVENAAQMGIIKNKVLLNALDVLKKKSGGLDNEDKSEGN